MRFFNVLFVICLFFMGSAASATTLEQLGKKLFEDTSLSNPPGQSCASCHDAAKAFTGTSGSSIAAVAAGADPTKFGTRNVPSLMYSSFIPAFSFVREKDEKGETKFTPTGGLFWDGRADTLEQQVSGPLTNPVEMGNKDAAAVAAKLIASPNHAAYAAIFGPPETQSASVIFANLSRAIATFERSTAFAPFSSKFDDVLRHQAKFTPEEAKGFALFKDKQKGNCISCHAGKIGSSRPRDWLFTDFTYDNLGVPRNAAIPANVEASLSDEGLCQRETLHDHMPKGLDIQTLCGAFKVPTLRNIALTAPYFHNGAISSLRDAVKFYVTRDTAPELWFPHNATGGVEKFNDMPPALRANVNTDEVPYDRKPGEEPRLNDVEIDAIVAFLKTLSDRPSANH